MKVKHTFFKKICSLLTYLLISVISCLFAFAVAVHFLNPAASKEANADSSPPDDQTKKAPSFQEAAKDVAKNVTQIFTDTFGEKKQNEKTNTQKSAKPSKQNQNVPKAPGNFEGKAYGESTPIAKDSPDNTQPSSPSADPSNQKASEVEAEIQSYIAPFIYEATPQQKSPFDDPTISSKEKQIQAIKKKQIIQIPKTPPEKYDLSDIELKGLIWETQTPRALFKLPNEEGFYTLKTGEKVGKQGIIVAIRENEVVVVEKDYIGYGKDRKETRTIKIKKMDRLGLKM